MSEISVVIPSYNSAATVVRTLESLLTQKAGKARDIIVVDSSDDGKTPSVLSAFESRGVQVLRLEQKTIPAIGRNLGAKKASGRVLAFIDSDAYAAPDWLEKIAQAFARGSRIGGGPVLLPEFQRGKIVPLAQYFLQFNEFLDTGERRAKMFVPSCNLFCERSLFDELGGFPEIRACEDVLFGVEAGKRSPVFFEPSVRIYHIFREEMGAYVRNQKLLGKYIPIFRRRRGAGWLYRGVLPVLLSPLFLLLKFLRITLRVFAMGKPGEIAAFFYSLPFFLVGLASWGAGFIEGCFSDE